MSDAIDYNARHVQYADVMRCLPALVAFWQAKHGLVADGKLGPVTRASVTNAADDRVPAHVLEEPTPREGVRPLAVAANPWPRWPGTPPPQRAAILSVFGSPGTPEAPNRAWRKACILEDLTDLPGVPAGFHVALHKGVEPQAREALTRAATTDYAIQRLGGYVLRHQRHDPNLPLSHHAWGIAFDVNADQNQAHQFPPGKTPAPWSDAWRARWPQGVTRAFVEAIESVGWRWGGRWLGFVDPMHFEWVA